MADYSNLFHDALTKVHDIAKNGARDQQSWLDVLDIVDTALAESRALPSIPPREGIAVQQLSVEYTASKGMTRVAGWVSREDGKKLRGGQDALISQIPDDDEGGDPEIADGEWPNVYDDDEPVSPAIPSREGVERWRGAEEIPSVKPGNMDEFILAVHNPKTDNVYTFAAHYLNKYPVEMDAVPCADCDNSCEAGDGCPLTGWHTLVGDGRYDAGCFYKLELREGRTIAGWTEVPLYAALSPSPTSVMPEKPNLEMTPLHLKLLKRGVQGQYIGLADDMAFRHSEMAALRDLHKMGFAEAFKGPLPPGPPRVTPSIITDAGRAFLTSVMPEPRS